MERGGGILGECEWEEDWGGIVGGEGEGLVSGWDKEVGKWEKEGEG